MAADSRSRPLAGYYKQMNSITSDLLEPVKKRRKLCNRGDYYQVERIICRRKDKYLLKWAGYSYYSCSWEEEDNLTPDLIRTFERPVISEVKLQENKDALLLGISIKLKSKSRAPTTISFCHDCYRLLFSNKGRQSQNGKWTILQRSDFDHCKFHGMWEQCLDKNGDGVVIKFSINMRPLLSWSPKMLIVKNGALVSAPRMPVEKLIIDFARKPFSTVTVM